MDTYLKLARSLFTKTGVKGGEGSGFFGHAGRPGEVGGSQPSGAVSYNDPTGNLEREFDRVNNEGGEGYNPYRAAREEREHQEAAEEHRRYAATPEGQRDAIHRELSHLDWAAGEHGLTHEDEERRTTLRTQLRDMDTQIETRKIADLESKGWSKEQTITKRNAWNTNIRRLQSEGVKIDSALQRKLEEEAGFSVVELRRAVETHKLPAWKPS